MRGNVILSRTSVVLMLWENGPHLWVWLKAQRLKHAISPGDGLSEESVLISRNANECYAPFSTKNT